MKKTCRKLSEFSVLLLARFVPDPEMFWVDRDYVYGRQRAGHVAAFGLLDDCEALAVAVGTSSLLAGANTARHETYRHLVARGFRTVIQGVTMHRYNDPGYAGPAPT